MNIDYVYTLPNQQYAPVIDGNTLDLPIKEMSWENFERLCLKMTVEVDGFLVTECDILGRKGQKQEGIDIYARKETNSYYTYQCKRYKSISVKKLEKFFDDFKEGDWFSKTKKFILCTSAEFSDTNLQTKFESIKNQFKKEGVIIEKWDSSYFNRTLKDFPKIVYDFFGKEWCEKFCGKEVYNKHIKEFKNRLDANEIASYKKELGVFYSHAFNIFDKGLPSLEDSDLRIEDRFVMLDSIKKVEKENEIIEEKNNEKDLSIDKKYLNLPFGVIQNEYNIEIVREQKNIKESTTYKTTLRTKLDLEIDENSIIIGEAGFGKSTFLRFLILNLLSNFLNSSTNISKKFGKFIPVYIPFAYLTSKLKEDRNRSLIQVLKLWFSSHDKIELFKLIELAFKDERLLLVVDGIDEYTSIEIAEIALDKLNIYKQNDNIRLILSSRPYGYRVLKEYIPEVKIHNISPLSIEQQKEIVKRWIKQKYTNEKTIIREVEDFINELSKAPDLKSLAETPLLLNILLVQKLKNLALPRNKFSAYNDITEHLINKHYQKRINSANAEIESSLSELRDYWKDIFSIVAFEFQTKSFDGVLTKKEVNNVVNTYLEEELGYLKEKRTRIANKFTEFGVNNIGILIEKSNEELAFIHRQFQEFLTANHLSKEEDLINIIQEFSSNPQWEQCIIFFFSHIVNKNKFKEYFQLVKEKCKELAYKIALSNKNCPIGISKENFNEIKLLYKKEQKQSIKNKYLDIILTGVSNPKLNDDYLNFVKTYLPNHFHYKDFRITSLEHFEGYEKDKVIIDFLFDHLINGNLKDKFDASRLLHNSCKDEEVVKRLLDMSYNSINLYTRAYAINSLINDNVDKNIIQNLIDDYIDCPNEEILYIIISAKVFLGTHKEEDLDTLLRISNKVFTYDFKDSMFWVITNGWKNSENLKNKCVAIVDENKRFDSQISKNAAWMLLFHNFNKDKDIINRVTKKIVEEEIPFSGSFDGEDIINHISFYFKENKKVTDAVMDYLLNKSEREFFSRHASHLCLISKDIRIKRFIIDFINKNDRMGYWEAYPLLENWKNDEDVITLVKKYLNREKVDTSLTQVVHKILNKKEGIEFCERVLFGNSSFRNRALKPLIDFDKGYFENKLLDKFVDEELEEFSKTDIFQSFWSAIWDLVRNFPNNKKVQLLIRKYDKYWIHYFDALVRSKAINKSEIYSNLNSSRPISFENRKIIIDEIINYEKYNHIIEDFEFESNDDCKTLLAYSYFKKNNIDKGLKKSEQLSLKRGSHYEVNMSLGLLGYLYNNRLNEYLNLLEKNNIKYKVNFKENFYSSYGFKEDYFKYLDLHFEHLYNAFNLKSDKYGYWTRKEKEDIYSLLIKYHSEKFTSKPYIFNFLKENYDNINSYNFINFLLDEYPNQPLTNQIVIDIINGVKGNDYYAFSFGLKIGRLFSNNETTKKLIIKNLDLNEKVCLTALLIGWNDEPLIDVFYKKFKEDKLNIHDRGIIYLLMFSRYTNDEIKSLINRLDNKEHDISLHQPYLINPLMYRINQEMEIQEYLIESLIKTSSKFMTVLFYSILKEINYKSEKLNNWVINKREDENSNLIIGYNLIENRYQSLTELLS